MRWRITEKAGFKVSGMNQGIENTSALARPASTVERTVFALVALFILWFGSYSYHFIYQYTEFKPLYSYFAVIGFALASFKVLARRIDFNDPGIKGFLAWLVVYSIYGSLALLNSPWEEHNVQAWITLNEMVLIGASFLIMLTGMSRTQFLYNCCAVLAVISTVFIVAGFFEPAFAGNQGRAAGLFGNPNIAADAVSMSMILGVNALPVRLRIPFAMVCGVGVLATFSRAGWILWAVGIMGLVWYGKFTEGWLNRSAERGLGGALALILLALFFSGGLGKMMSITPVAKYLTPHTEARLGLEENFLQHGSVSTRYDLLLFSLKKAAEAPLTGQGLGETRVWDASFRPHNTYLLLLVEGGVMALLLYVALLVFLLYYSAPIGQIVTIQIILLGAVSHNLLEFPVYILFLTLVVASGALSKGTMMQRA
jgi:O-antigen ligase